MMGEYAEKSTSRGIGFDNSNVAYSAIGISDVEVANEQVMKMYDEVEATVYFTCANVAAARIRDNVNLYNTFSRDEIDALLFYCMEAYRRVKERRPFDGSSPFEAYITKFVLPTGRQLYARSKQTDYDHLVSTAVNKNGEKSYYGTNGKMVKFSTINDLDDEDEYNRLESRYEDGFEDLIINKVDAENVLIDEELLSKLATIHPLLKIVFNFWASDCKDGYLPFYKYLSDERVLRLAARDEKCAKYVLQKDDGKKYINPSTASKLLYKFQSILTAEEVKEIIRFGTNVTTNPYLGYMMSGPMTL
ncbi:hypothetical protein [Pseudobutyrivibrio ruminis]|uniref:hypothetical protein n=1 Tax=Pseudobutyrivibrio ruminis TaxID=46206 RepID=UPI0016709B62|nr:hypothetical protein [Pseudobutyrivibrio ruminis]